jgi:hypothetical protein
MQQFSSIHNAAFGAALYGYAPAGTAALDADAPYRPPDDAAALMSTPPRHLHTRAPAAESPLAAETLGLTSLAARLSIGADLAPAPRAAERYEPPAPARPPVPGWPLRSAPAPPPLPVWSPGGYAAAATAAAATAALPPAPASMPRARADASWPYMPGLPVAEAPPAGPPACYRAPARQAALREEQPHGYSLRSRGPPAPPPAQRTPAHAAPPAPPPPPAPMTPPLRRGMSPAAALRSLGHLLTPAERAEVATYREVWFAGRPGCAKVRGAAAAGPNGGFDDARGDYRAAPGNHVAFRYELQHVLGRGSFGQVVRALDHAAGGAPVALKIIRNKARFARQAQVEAAILAALGAADPAGTSGAVRMLEAFTFRSHLCITFECLAENLYEHLKAGGFVGCAPELVTRTARTVLRCLAFLRRLDIVHCDLKARARGGGVLSRRIRANFRLDSLCAAAFPRPAAGEHPPRRARRLPGARHRLWLLLLLNAAHLHLYPEPLLPRARGIKQRGSLH